MTTRTKAPAAPQIAVGDRVTVPPLPGLPGLPGVWVVDGEELCGHTRYLLLPRKGQPGWYRIAETRCVRVGERKASA